MIVKVQVNKLQQMFEDELERVRDMRRNRIGNASNNNAQIKKCEFMLYLLCAVEDDTVITVETCRGDDELRGFALANAGSVVECLVNALMDKNAKGEYGKTWNDDNEDVMVGNVKYEVKFSGESHYLATPAKDDKPIILINRDGVSVIRKADIAEAVNARGKLPARGLFGKRNHPTVLYLENALGLVGGFDALEA